MTPRVCLALDNCFAKKRWCEPEEWIPLVAELGIRYVEASADNEIDPFFSRPAFVADWRQRVLLAGKRHGVQVATCYSGHGTYSTLGLGHFDARIREHMRDGWMRPMIELAASLDAGLGFFAHAFDEKTLREPARYAQAYDRLIADIGVLSRYAASAGLRGFGIEQMYSPNHVPWTLEGTEDFLRRANAVGGGAPVYVTVDTGHQSGQHLFLAPDRDALADYHALVRAGQVTTLYLGCREHEAGFRRAVAAGLSPVELEGAVAEFAATHAYLFAKPEDSDLYRWLERFARCSPIIHLQQTDGRSSAHLNFTAANNRTGVVDPGRVLRAMDRSFAGAPPVPETVYLVLEPFLPTACNTRVWLDKIAESVLYWRGFIPRDGMALDQLVAGLAP